MSLKIYRLWFWWLVHGYVQIFSPTNALNPEVYRSNFPSLMVFVNHRPFLEQKAQVAPEVLSLQLAGSKPVLKTSFQVFAFDDFNRKEPSRNPHSLQEKSIQKSQNIPSNRLKNKKVLHVLQLFLFLGNFRWVLLEPLRLFVQRWEPSMIFRVFS